MSRERATSDYFSRDPHRLVDALLNGELSWHAYSVVSFMVNIIDHGREPRPFDVESLDALHRRMRFPLHKRTLLRALNEAREKAWIDFAPPKGSAKDYSFTLGVAAIDALARQSDVTPEALARHARVTPGVTDADDPEPAKPHEQTDSESPWRDTASSLRSREGEKSKAFRPQDGLNACESSEKRRSDDLASANNSRDENELGFSLAAALRDVAKDGSEEAKP